MIYKFCEFDDIPQEIADDIHAYGVMRTRQFKPKQKGFKISFLSAFYKNRQVLRELVDFIFFTITFSLFSLKKSYQPFFKRATSSSRFEAFCFALRINTYPLTSFGGVPKCFVNALEKLDCSLYPTARAVLHTEYPFFRSSSACSIRVFMMYSFIPIPE